MRYSVGLLILELAAVQGLVSARPVRIGPETILAESPRSHYSRYVNWRPADGETVRLNPPRMSWPYWPDWPNDFRDALYTFNLQISANADCSDPVVDVTCPCNFYNMLPALIAGQNRQQNRWHWRVSYKPDLGRSVWSEIRSFTISEDAVVWDRSELADPGLDRMGHPRILFNAENLNRIRRLAQTDSGSE
ncbi:MAG: DUF4962 domain-containing protein, partial [Planctomycetota bacterium]